ncbi:NAD(P)-dependent oxidoreductase [Paraglaciecola polaris]|uniref:2-hydroxy-3-oxopropionate reductase n=1 Tax=Paraglaciecola polaris LMG 21857 TaxID=1129793 RepID=K6Z761_9ALTE|nr:NAD(P)-dependent oxidoreductase [Paraglaciecola polaris]GAC32041.1 2-hydroxy-3-oxopropionate reductase [Paraglaciecola polaris LMG 21857]
MTINVAFIGLGVMGFPMAGHLANAGHNVTVYNRTQSKAQSWMTSYQGEMAQTPGSAVKNADIIFICVGNDDDLRSVILGERGILACAKNGAIIVDHTTASANVARELAELCQAKEIDFLDAPVSGGQAGAEKGQLTVMLGGQQASYVRVQPIIDAYAKFSQLLGPVGSGQLAKMMNQICIAGVVQGLAEALHFGQNAGLDCSAVIDVISQGAAQSWQMENRSSTMLKGQYDFGFAVDWMRKDLGIALDEARKNGSTLALTALVDQFYADVQRQGGNRFDTSSLLARLHHS